MVLAQARSDVTKMVMNMRIQASGALRIASRGSMPEMPVTGNSLELLLDLLQLAIQAPFSFLVKVVTAELLVQEN